MEQTFIAIIQKLIAEQGKAVLFNAEKCRALVADYTGSEFKMERRLFLMVVEADVPQAVDSTSELAIEKQRQVKELQDKYFLDPKLAAEQVDMLAFILRGDASGVQARNKAVASKPMPQPVDQQPYQVPPVTPQTAPISPPAPPVKSHVKRNVLIAVTVALVAGIGIWAWYEHSQAMAAAEQARIAAENKAKAAAEQARIAAEAQAKAIAEQQKMEAAGLVHINGGTFTMGSPANEASRNDDEGPQHSVTVNSFYLGKYEVTQKEWREVMGNNPSYFKGDNLPVEQVSWYDAVEYCNKRSQREGLISAYTINGTNVTWNKYANGYRLPTEAEWEYACRAGTTTPFSTGNNITTNQANYNGNYLYNNGSKGVYREKTWAVGSGAANAWGLYDMHGNVFEWCWGWYGNYSSSSQTDPAGAVSGAYRVARGGYFGYGAAGARSAYRHSIPGNGGASGIGFRLVRNG